MNYTYTQRLKWSIELFVNGSRLITFGIKTCKQPSLCEMGSHFSRRFSDRSHFFITKVAIDHYSLWLNYTSTQKLQGSIEHFFNGSAIDPLGVKNCKWSSLCKMGSHLSRGYSDRSCCFRTKCVIDQISLIELHYLEATSFDRNCC